MANMLASGEMLENIVKFQLLSKRTWRLVINEYSTLTKLQDTAYSFYVYSGVLSKASILDTMPILKWREIVIQELENQFGPLA